MKDEPNIKLRCSRIVQCLLVFSMKNARSYSVKHSFTGWDHEMVQTSLLELVGRSDSHWAGDSATRQSVTEYRCGAQNVTMCNRSLKQTAISLSSCEAEFYAASACAAELLGLAELFKELHYNVSVRLEMDSDAARHFLQRRDQADSNTSSYDACQYSSGYEGNVYP